MSQSERRDSARSFYSRIREYERLLHAGSSFAGGLTIYSNDEQLALVAVDGIREYVRYIEYKNIRAVLIQRHPLWLKALIVSLVMVGILSLILLANDGFAPVFPVWLLLAAMLGGGVILSLRNCSVRIVTDVYDHHLSQVHRYRQARRLLEVISRRMEPYLEPPAEPQVPGSAAEVVSEAEDSSAAAEERLS